MIPTALTIAGSDPSGGAGILADIKTFSRLKVYGMAVITALTAQNTAGIRGVQDVTADFVESQLDAVVSDIMPSAVKTGMLPNAAVVDVVSRKLRQYEVQTLVVDPVMISTSGSPLMSPDAVEALRRLLLPLALVVTPNLDEVCVLSGRAVRSVDDMEEAALHIHGLGARYVYVKGGHLEGPPTDVLFDGTDFVRFTAERIPTGDSHGTGCVLSAAMTAYLARGESVADSVKHAKDFVSFALRNALRLGNGHRPCDPIGIQGEE